MANLNRVLLIGNLTRDPELRYTPKGTAVAEITLAINRTWKDENGEKKEEVIWADVTLWARQADVAQQYLRKGGPVFIEGRLQLDTWEAKGQKRSKLRVVAENLQLLGSRPAAAPPPSPRTAPTAPVPTRSAPPEPELDVDPSKCPWPISIVCF